MATERQIMANQRNALKSTGPKTPEGKLITSRNATRHGFYSRAVFLPEEDRNEYMRLARGVVSFYLPQTVLEDEHVLIIIHTLWQLRRANIVDTELFQMYRICDGEEGGVGTAFAQDATQGNAFTKLTRYQSFLFKKLELARKELVHLQAARPARERMLTVGQSAPSRLLLEQAIPSGTAVPAKAAPVLVIAQPLTVEATPIPEHDEPA
jgi:hypothetical protein